MDPEQNELDELVKYRDRTPTHPAWQHKDEHAPLDWRDQTPARQPPSPYESLDCEITSPAPLGNSAVNAPRGGGHHREGPAKEAPGAAGA